MAEKGDYNHFVCIVAGENPEELMRSYGKDSNIEKTILYYFSDAHKIKNYYIQLYNALISKENDEMKKALLEEDLDNIKEDTDSEFFDRITQKYEHDDDGNAVGIKENSKYSECNIGGLWSSPFILKDGSNTFKAKKDDIDWNRIHMNDETITPYRIAWELVKENRKPENAYEKGIFNNMKDLGSYLTKFGTKENYIASCCSFWGYAFVSEETGWKELEPEMEQFDWVSCFFEKFIVPLQSDTLLTIYECRRD